MPGYFGDYQGPNWWDQYFYPGVAVIVIAGPFFIMHSAIYASGAVVSDVSVAGGHLSAIHCAGASLSE